MSVLELLKVSKSYDGASEVVNAVQDATMSIKAGEIVVLFGPSGSGKSTLLLLAAGVLEPDTGSVLSGKGRDLSTLTEAELSARLREEVGISYQYPNLLQGHSVLTNTAIKLWSGPKSMAEAQRAALPWLARVGLGSRLDHHPEQLSGGERQRVGIARALVGDPSLLLLDEPTARLDSQRGNEILDMIASAAKEGTGVLLVTHDKAAVRIASRVLELRDGQLAAARHERAA